MSDSRKNSREQQQEHLLTLLDPESKYLIVWFREAHEKYFEYEGRDNYDCSHHCETVTEIKTYEETKKLLVTRGLLKRNLVEDKDLLRDAKAGERTNLDMFLAGVYKLSTIEDLSSIDVDNLLPAHLKKQFDKILKDRKKAEREATRAYKQRLKELEQKLAVEREESERKMYEQLKKKYG